VSGLPSGIALRDAVPGDEGLVAHFVRQLAVYEKLEDQATGTPEMFARALFGTPPRVFAMLVEDAGRPIGLALYYFNFSTFMAQPGLYLEDIFVEPEYRGRGIGKAIFRKLASRALDEGCARMEWSVLDWNAPSIAFYRSLGAVGMDEWTVQRLQGETLARVAGR
jgi:GNAT superfamily N-acetyltransferase